MLIQKSEIMVHVQIAELLVEVAIEEIVVCSGVDVDVVDVVVVDGRPDVMVTTSVLGGKTAGSLGAAASFTPSATAGGWIISPTDSIPL